MNEYYYANYEIKTFEEGTYRGYDWEIKSNGSYPSRYIITPEEECIIFHYDRRNDFILCRGDESGHVWTRDEIYADIIRVINELADDEEERRAKEEAERKHNEELDRRAQFRFRPDMMISYKMYRLVGENDEEWTCYDCGHSEVHREYSPWFFDKKQAEEWLFRHPYDREYIEESIVYSSEEFCNIIN